MMPNPSIKREARKLAPLCQKLCINEGEGTLKFKGTREDLIGKIQSA